MAQQTVKQTKMTHKDGQPRRTLHRTRLKQNGQRVDLRKVATHGSEMARRLREMLTEWKICRVKWVTMEEA